MRTRLRPLTLLAAAAAALALASSGLNVLLGAQAPASFRAPRTADGKANLNGIWQAINEANWDIEGHSAAPGRVLALGAEDAVVPGLGIGQGIIVREPFGVAALITPFNFPFFLNVFKVAL